MDLVIGVGFDVFGCWVGWWVSAGVVCGLVLCGFLCCRLFWWYVAACHLASDGLV